MMTNTITIRQMPMADSRETAALLRERRRRALLNTALEALATIGLSACFILCAVMVMCMV